MTICVTSKYPIMKFTGYAGAVHDVLVNSGGEVIVIYGVEHDAFLFGVEKKTRCLS